MKARITNKNDLTMSPSEQRRRGVELINRLRAQGLSDNDICKKIGVPADMKDRFFEHLGVESKPES